MANKNRNEQDSMKSLQVFRDKWSRGKLSLLSCHIFFAIDETRDLYGWTEDENMVEAEEMFLQLMSDIKKLIPEVREKKSIRNIEKELLKEGSIEDESI